MAVGISFSVASKPSATENIKREIGLEGFILSTGEVLALREAIQKKGKKVESMTGLEKKGTVGHGEIRGRVRNLQ